MARQYGFGSGLGVEDVQGGLGRVLALEVRHSEVARRMTTKLYGKGECDLMMMRIRNIIASGRKDRCHRGGDANRQKRLVPRVGGNEKDLSHGHVWSTRALFF